MHHYIVVFSLYKKAEKASERKTELSNGVEQAQNGY